MSEEREMETKSVRLPSGLIDEIEAYAEGQGANRSDAMRNLLRRGLGVDRGNKTGFGTLAIVAVGVIYAAVLVVISATVAGMVAAAIGAFGFTVVDVATAGVSGSAVLILAGILALIPAGVSN